LRQEADFFESGFVDQNQYGFIELLGVTYKGFCKILYGRIQGIKQRDLIDCPTQPSPYWFGDEGRENNADENKDEEYRQYTYAGGIWGGAVLVCQEMGGKIAGVLP